MSKLKGDDMFQACIYDLKEVLGDDVQVEGMDMDQAFALVMTGGDEISTSVFLTCDEDIEAIASTLEKVAMEIRTLKKSSLSIH
jgi:hypothetical protein